MCRFALVLLALAALPARAQTPDTTSTRRYLPLAVGNEWHYNRTETATNWPTTSVQTRHVVLSESPAQPGRFVVETTTLRTVGAGEPVVTTQRGVWYVDPATRRASTSGLPAVDCPLNTPWSGGSCDYRVRGGYGRAVVVPPDTLITSSKEFERSINGNIGITYRYAAGLGLHAYFYQETIYGPGGVLSFRSETDLLRYVRVGGVEYGARLSSFPIASDDLPLAAGLRLSVAPNPVPGATTVSYTLAVPGAVRVTVNDMLGRTVAVLVSGERMPGANTVALDTGRLALGVYLVRLEAGGMSVVRRLTVVR